VAGGLFETFVVMELIKQATWSVAPVEVFFYRDTEMREVDLIIESASSDVVAIEAKAASIATASDARGLRLLRDKLGHHFKTGVVVYSGAHTLPSTTESGPYPSPDCGSNGADRPSRPTA